ncbi:iron uptake porin [Anabaena cylindrica FACHB-243]|uniref:Cyanobacterial porin n=1 Tax=Anabaena cylindrica (strain ATCC 27899 / PCC 7122) TaxID=272123 RepID=K9ZD75_ANACC|nr:MULTISPECIES: iron uptake porin [Anabaena]AFZ57136.1 cyanobacterial porin [Anabaena cylindrica PCC 7122]MBD2418022.1 iron uptake porin [Anabaena cylindrica FACHB-243]MCM2408772.1 iron uptake porin [Anabaena sp. CCAP 1446/1C]BAY05894.1 carbohydrate-selective porin OprB [Anabaena cylindrica PCC 7122]
MTKLFWNILKVSPVIAATFLSANSALAAEVNEQATSVAQLSKESNSIGQVTSVSQFSDVQPTDWAFQALQSLVERYGCIAGYPNGTYRGNRALTRYEFAAGLNACLDRVNELIATATADMVNKEDLATLQRLQEEFSAELATLRGRVDALEARTAELEANQFSTTTKLKGEAIFALSGAFGDKKADGSGDDLQDNVTFSDRVRLSLESSFTGTDRLQVRLQARNNIQFDGARTGTSMTRLGFDGNNNNSVELDQLNYAFNFGENIRVKVDAVGGDFYDFFNSFNPDFSSSGSGSISRYGRFSPIYRHGGEAGLQVQFNPKGKISLGVGYLANEANNPSAGSGLLDGNYAALAQLEFKPSNKLGIGLTYVRSYYGSSQNIFDSTGSSFANRVVNNEPASLNNYGVQASFKATDKITVGGWGGYSDVKSETTNKSADVWYWAATLGIKDFGRQGNTLGLIFGQPPKATSTSNIANGDDNGTSYHIEGLYKMKISDNILITPGLLVILNPEHNDNRDTIYIGTLRTTFSF